jgi:hypothetical protein
VYVCVYPLATFAGHLQPEPDAPARESPVADRGRERGVTVLLTAIKSVSSGLAVLSRSVQELKNPKPSGRRSSVVEVGVGFVDCTASW